MQANTSIPEVIRTIQSHYNYTACWLHLEKKGKEYFGPKFRLYEEDAGIILKLMIYFLQDISLAQKCKIDLSKGIIITGPVGCGKTTLMKLMNELLPMLRRHMVRACREVAFEFGVDGYEAIQRYARKSFNQFSKTPITYCFDDLGLEPVVHHYGNVCNVMAEILLSRYDLFVRNKMLTHITTNLNSSELEGLYGVRIRSRCREMFNLVSFNVNSVDKRS